MCRGERFAAKKILALRDCLKVVGIHACTIATKMVYLQALRDWTDEPFVCEAMRGDKALSAIFSEVEVAIATRSPSASPFPTIIAGSDLGYEADKDGSILKDRWGD